MLSFILQFNSNSSISFGQLPVVKRFMKGIFEPRPALPRYKSIWDVSLAWIFSLILVDNPRPKRFYCKIDTFSKSPQWTAKSND